MNVTAGIFCTIGMAIGSVRWFRVAQREHYIPGYVARYAWRWWNCAPYNQIIGIAACIAILVSIAYSGVAFAVAPAVVLAPLGLSLRGRTSKLVWTRRMKTVAGVTAAVVFLWLFIGAIGGLFAASAAMAALAMPFFIDVALTATEPWEKKNAQQFVDKATSTLQKLNPKTMAVTGSFGKTTTKGYIKTLLAESFPTAASPASFNNRAGLARAINESLPAGTKWFIAEMDSWEAGEITELCEWIKPEIGVLCAVGPVHLERFKNEDEILVALAEVFDFAKVAVVNCDDERIAKLADQLAERGLKVTRCGTTKGDVTATRDGRQITLKVDGKEIGRVDGEEHVDTNVACAVGAALAAGVSTEAIGKALGKLEVPDHRRTTATGSTGATIIDNTFNSSPKGVEYSLQFASQKATSDHKLVVVTPGIIELGKEQYEFNRKFAEDAGKLSTDFLAVGFTNKAAMLAGATDSKATVHWFPLRDSAVNWVRKNVGPGDVVLYENDLPDHIP